MIFEQECSKRGVRLVYRSLPESDPATDMVLRSVLQAFDEYHSLISRAKGLAGMAENIRQGWRAGGKAPRGYRLEYHATGAIREGAPVLKSKLVRDDETAPLVQAYLRLRARGIPRGVAIARLSLPWPATSTHSMDWQALTYAGHTVWGMHREREGGAAAGGQKRRPRSEWTIARGTHEALITDDEAEAILAQQERALQGRRGRATPMLLTGLLVAPDGSPWHSDGCGHYRLGKGRKIASHRVDSAVLGQLGRDLCSDDSVTRLLDEMRRLAGGEPVDGRQLAGLERRIGTLTEQIGRTVDLASQIADPTPVLRRVADLEHQRALLVDQLATLRAQRDQASQASTITVDHVRALLRRLLDEISAGAQDIERRAEVRMALAEVIERIELDADATALRLHYAVAAGDMVASPRPAHVSPYIIRWTSPKVTLPARRRVA